MYSNCNDSQQGPIPRDASTMFDDPVPAKDRVTKDLWQTQAPTSQYARPSSDPLNFDRQEQRMGHGLFENVHPNPGRGCGWNVTDRRPLPPALAKRPNHMLNIDFKSLIGPPTITEQTMGNKVWQNDEQARRLAFSNTKMNSGSGALNTYSLFGPETIATGGGDPAFQGLSKTVYGYTFQGYGNASNRRVMPSNENKRREFIDKRTRLPDKAYAKPGGMYGQEQSRVGLMKLPKNSDIWEIPHRSMLPQTGAGPGLSAGPEFVVMKQQRRVGDGTIVAVGPPSTTIGDRPMYRDQIHTRTQNKQTLNLGYQVLSQGGRDYGDPWAMNEVIDTRDPKQQYTERAARPANPGFIGGLEFVGDVQKGLDGTLNGRIVPSDARHTKRVEWNDYQYQRFKVPEPLYGLQYNQQFPYMGDRRKTPPIEVSPDSAILAPYRSNPFAAPLNPFTRKTAGRVF